MKHFSGGQMGAHAKFQHLKYLSVKGQHHILLKLCKFWHYFAPISEQNVKENGTQIVMNF